MNPKPNSQQVPHDYTLCLNRQCPQASTCLRQVAEELIDNSVKSYTVLLPKHLATLSGSCPYYRPSTKIEYAQGLTDTLDDLSQRQIRTFKSLMLRKFSLKTYFRIRKGERLLLPSEQQEILRMLRECGVISEKVFDTYTQGFDW